MPHRFIIIIMFLAALSLGFFLVWPKYQDFQQLQIEIMQKEGELNSKTAYYSKINEANEKLKEYQNVLNEIDAAIAKSYSVPVLFNYLQQTAGETGLIVKNLILEDVTGKEIKEINIHLQMSGAYPSLKSFLSALDNSARFFRIKSVIFSSPVKGSAFSFDVGVATYSY